MTLIYVQFSDHSEAAIISYFGSPQPVEYWPNQSTVTASDPRWLAYYDAQPLLLQRMLPAPIQCPALKRFLVVINQKKGLADV